MEERKHIKTFEDKTSESNASNIINQLIEDYERRLKTVLEEIKPLKLSEELKEERLNTKASCYRTFIAELRRELNSL